MIERGSVKIVGKVMDHARGAWAGMRPNWYTATHEPTGFSVTWHEWGDRALPQSRQRDAALACLDLMIEEMMPADLPLAMEKPDQR